MGSDEEHGICMFVEPFRGVREQDVIQCLRVSGWEPQGTLEPRSWLGGPGSVPGDQHLSAPGGAGGCRGAFAGYREF